MSINYGQPGGVMPPQQKVRFEAIGEAWRLFSANPATWILASLVMAVSSVVFSGLQQAVEGLMKHFEDSSAFVFPLLGAGLVLMVLQVTVSVWLYGGLIQMGVRQARGEYVQLADLLNYRCSVLSLIAVSLIVAFASLGGFLLCILPGIIVAGLLMLAAPLVVDRQMGSLAAARASWDALKSDWLNAGLFNLVVLLIQGAGVLACCVGLLVTYPLSFLRWGIVYRDVFGGGQPVAQTQAYPPQPPAPPTPPAPPVT